MNTYDFYTGHGFKKVVSTDFKAQQPDGNTYDPRVSLDANKAIPLPPAADQTAKSSACTAQLFRPRGNILPIVGAQVEQMNTQTLVSLGWQSFNLTGSDPAAEQAGLPAAAAFGPRQKVSNLQRLTIPTDAPPTLRPGAQGQVSLAEGRHARHLRAARREHDVHAGPTGAILGNTEQQPSAQGGQPPRIYRVTVVQAPVCSRRPRPRRHGQRLRAPWPRPRPPYPRRDAAARRPRSIGGSMRSRRSRIASRRR